MEKKIMESIYSAFTMEIGNKIEKNKNKLIVYFPDDKKAKIEVNKKRR